MSVFWGSLFELVFFIGPAITCVACVGYARRVRTRLSVTLAVAATGVLVGGIAGQFFGLIVLPGLSASETSPLAFQVIMGILVVVGVAFSLLFSVCLLLVLRGAAAGPVGDNKRAAVEPPVLPASSGSPT